MMRSQVSNSGQQTGSSDQKKSVFDRLGRQLDVSSSSRSMKRRSPGPRGSYGEYMPPPPSMRDGDFGRYGRGSDSHSQAAEMEWRHLNEHRHMSQFSSRDRHPPSQPPSQLPPPPPPGHYELEMSNSRVQPQFYAPHPHQAYNNGPPLGSVGPAMSLRQQRASPKCDRHGNLIGGMFKERGPMRMGPIDHHPGMSPPSRNFIPSGSMLMHPAHEMPSHEMPPMRSRGDGNSSMYAPPRWHNNLEQPDFPPHGRMMQEGGRFSPIDSRAYQQQQVHVIESNQNPSGSIPTGDLPRYAKWRERRDVITTLDRETAQSSSRTDSLKSTLQQPDNRIRGDHGPTDNMSRRMKGNLTSNKKPITNNNMVVQKETKTEGTEPKPSTSADKESTLLSGKETSTPNAKKPKPSKKVEPQDISDGEIVDDEDSSDDSETARTVKKETNNDKSDSHQAYLDQSVKPTISRTSYVRSRDGHKYYDSSKKRRLMDRDEYAMDYETISDEDLDDFMEDKKILDLGSDVSKLNDKLREASGLDKSLSEIELLHALGLDWANLVELAKQSKTSSKESYTPGSALPRFSMPNYLPTLGITPELAGPELYGLILKTCHA